MELTRRFPAFTFKAGSHFRYAPEERIIYYRAKELASDQGQLQLLHELGHAILSHTAPSDEDRYQIERDAWDVARVLAEKLGVRVSHQQIARSLRETRRLGY